MPHSSLTIGLVGLVFGKHLGPGKNCGLGQTPTQQEPNPNPTQTQPQPNPTQPQLNLNVALQTQLVFYIFLLVGSKYGGIPKITSRIFCPLAALLSQLSIVWPYPCVTHTHTGWDKYKLEREK